MDKILDDAIAYASSKGILVYNNDSLCHHAPMTLLPTKFPRNAFNQAVALAQITNILVDKIADDVQWMYRVLDGVIQHVRLHHFMSFCLF